MTKASPELTREQGNKDKEAKGQTHCHDFAPSRTRKDNRDKAKTAVPQGQRGAVRNEGVSGVVVLPENPGLFHLWKSSESG